MERHLAAPSARAFNANGKETLTAPSPSEGHANGKHLDRKSKAH
jgi:hypothetical protein